MKYAVILVVRPLLLLKTSIDFRKLGFIGDNIYCISSHWKCEIDYLEGNNIYSQDCDTIARAGLIKNCKRTCCLPSTEMRPMDSFKMCVDINISVVLCANISLWNLASCDTQSVCVYIDVSCMRFYYIHAIYLYIIALWGRQYTYIYIYSVYAPSFWIRLRLSHMTKEKDEPMLLSFCDFLFLCYKVVCWK